MEAESTSSEPVDSKASFSLDDRHDETDALTNLCD